MPNSLKNLRNDITDYSIMNWGMGKRGGGQKRGSVQKCIFYHCTENCPENSTIPANQTSLASISVSMNLCWIPFDANLENAWKAGTLESHLGTSMDAAIHETLTFVISATFNHLRQSPRTPELTCFLVVDSDMNAVVGSCGFKGAPNGDGEVEIAYFTFPPFERRGYAKAMAADLVRRATTFGCRAAIAHTLPEMNASGHVLMCNGFVRVRTVLDPDDGLIWQWRKELASD